MTPVNKLAVCSWFIFMAVLYVFTSSGIFASHSLSEDSIFSDCQQLTFKRIRKEGKKYTFSVKASCTISKEYMSDVQNIVSNYVEHVNENSNVRILEHDENIQFQGLEGHGLKLIERFDSGHGQMNITGDLFIVSNRIDQFIYHFKSNKIDAEGEAKSTKRVIAKVLIEPKERDFDIYMEKLVVVEKSWWWPEGVFEQEVKSGVLKEMNELVKMHKELIVK